MDARIFAGIVVLLVLVGGCATQTAPEPKATPAVEPKEIEVKETPVVEEPVVESAPESDIKTVTLHTSKEDIVIQVEVADTEEARATGLSGRTKLDENTGMLFVFPETAQVDFNMKGVPFLVDIIFIGEDMMVKNMATMVPCRSEVCPVWHSREAVKYALEVPGSFIKNHPMGRDVTVTLG